MLHLENETLFYEEQETRYQKALDLFKEEKALLTAKDDTLLSQLKNLQKYLDLKDKQLNDLRNELQTNDEKMRKKDLLISNTQTNVQSLNETIKELQEQNLGLENRIK